MRYKLNCEEEVVVDVFKEGMFELLALTETKLKGDGEVSWCGVNDITDGVQMERLIDLSRSIRRLTVHAVPYRRGVDGKAREGAAILLNGCVAQCNNRLLMRSL